MVRVDPLAPERGIAESGGRTDLVAHDLHRKHLETVGDRIQEAFDGYTLAEVTLQLLGVADDPGLAPGNDCPSVIADFARDGYLLHPSAVVGGRRLSR